MGCVTTPVSSPREKSHLLREVLRDGPPELTRVLAEREKYRLQILYTQIDRDTNNRPTFHSWGIGLDDDRYFYPASTVKLPVAILALEKLHHLAIEGVDRSTTMLIGAGAPGQTAAETDPSAKRGVPSVGHYVKKIFLVSDNDAYNRLYEFLGQAPIRTALTAKGYDETAILRRLSLPLTPEENRITNPVRFVDDGRVLYQQEVLHNPDAWTIDGRDTRQGVGHYSGGELIHDSIDFSHSNAFPIEEQQRVLRALLFPETEPPAARFDLSPDDEAFLLRHLSMLPRESRDPAYDDREEYYDSYGKFLLFGDRRETIPPSIRIFNKVGQAYGYLLDNAYVVDFENRIEFFLTVVLQVNENQIYNDDTYEYETVGYPFLGALGRTIYEYELDRVREHPPDLARFDVH